ncbi:MAG: hypothetical protein Q7T29_03630 [Gallionella sp.]|nr:hypothetical protein [Gallionella sp.]
MKLSNAPFYLTLISGVLPLFAAFFDSKFFVYLPFMLTAIALLLFWFANQGVTQRVSAGMVALLLFLLAHGVGTGLTIGHGSLGLLGLVLTSMIYVQLFNSAGTSLDPGKLVNQLAIVYLLHMAYLFLELFLKFVGYQDLLLSLFGAAKNVTKMKNYNSAAFLQVLGFPDGFFGLNGMLLGSQSAGQVMVCAFIVSALWYKYSPLKGAKQWIFNAVALFAFLCAVNMTMVLTLAMVCLLMIYVIPFSRMKKTAIQLIVPLGVMSFFSAVAALLFYRLSNYDSDVEIYAKAFRAPVETFFDFTLWELMFGLGRTEVRADAADFGLAMLASQVGFVFMVVVGLVLGNILISALRETRRVASWGASLSLTEKKWLWLATVNALISFVFAMGLVHYTPSVELGGLQMFAFSIALTIISVRNLRSFRHPPVIKGI